MAAAWLKEYNNHVQTTEKNLEEVCHPLEEASASGRAGGVQHLPDYWRLLARARENFQDDGEEEEQEVAHFWKRQSLPPFAATPFQPNAADKEEKEEEKGWGFTTDPSLAIFFLGEI